MSILKELHRKDIGELRGVHWFYIAYKSKYGYNVYHIMSSDWRKFIYTKEYGVSYSGGDKKKLPKSIRDKFIELINS